MFKVGLTAMTYCEIFNIKVRMLTEAARLGRELSLPESGKGDEESLDNQEYYQNNDSLNGMNEKPPSRKISEIGPPPQVNPSKNSPAMSSPDLIEANQPQSIPEDINYNHPAQIINDEPMRRRFSAMSTSSPPVQVSLYLVVQLFNDVGCEPMFSCQQERQIHSESAPASRRSSLAASTFSPIAEHVAPPMTTSVSHEQILPPRCPVQ